MQVLSTQAQHADTDLDVTMKFPIQFFRPTLAAVMAMTLVGCGGGSNNGQAVIATGTVTQVITSGLSSPKHMTFDPSDNLYVANSGGGNILKFDANGQSTSFAVQTSLSYPLGIAYGGNNFNSNGYLYVSDSDEIKQISPTGVVNSYESNLTNAYGIAFDSSSNLYVAEQTSNIIDKTVNGGTVSPPYITSAGGFPIGLAIFGNNLYVSNWNTSASGANLLKFDITSPASSISIASGLASANGVAVDSSGNIYVVLRKVQHISTKKHVYNNMRIITI
jgi:sugar lactone lactonase YvrE